MGVAPPPHRPSDRPIPRLKGLSDRRKVVYYEYGTDVDERTGKTSLYVDIINGNSDLVDYVGFRFARTGETHNVYKRKPVRLSDGTDCRRFLLKEHEINEWHTRSGCMTVVVFGKGGSMRVRHLKATKGREFRERPLRFLETRDLRWNYVALPPTTDFGVEIETSLSGSTTSGDVAAAIRNLAGVSVIDRTTSPYRHGTEDYSEWQLVPDSSTACSIHEPHCNKFELVSRVLRGEDGLGECGDVLRAMRSVGRASCNRSMGLHVHVSVKDLSIENLKNICLNFIKHEDAIDSFMPASRRNNNGNYCRSNKAFVRGIDSGAKHSAIVACSTIADLCSVMGDDRYFKLNLRNLLHHSSNSNNNDNDNNNNNKKKHKPTIEFRQHSSTTSFGKIEAWVRFCTSLVRNSNERPQKLKHYEDEFDSLFDTAIQDLKLKEFYRDRRDEFAHDHHDDDHDYDYDDRDNEHNHNGCARKHVSCSGCLKGGACTNHY